MGRGISEVHKQKVGGGGRGGSEWDKRAPGSRTVAGRTVAGAAAGVGESQAEDRQETLKSLEQKIQIQSNSVMLWFVALTSLLYRGHVAAGQRGEQTNDNIFPLQIPKGFVL